MASGWRPWPMRRPVLDGSISDVLVALRELGPRDLVAVRCDRVKTMMNGLLKDTLTRVIASQLQRLAEGPTRQDPEWPRPPVC